MQDITRSREVEKYHLLSICMEIKIIYWIYFETNKKFLRYFKNYNYYGPFI